MIGSGIFVLPRQVGAVLHVRDDHQRAHRRHERSVAIVALALVLGEVARLEHLADVVEIRPDAHQQPAGADRFGRRFGQRRHGDRMVVRARRAANQFLQQRMRRIAQLDQAQDRSARRRPFRPSAAGTSSANRRSRPTSRTISGRLQREPDRLAFERADAERREHRHARRQKADRQQLAAAAHAAQAAGSRRPSPPAARPHRPARAPAPRRRSA